MLASLIIVFREMLEAGLIVGIVLAASAGVPKRGRWVAGGIAAGALGAGIVAAFTGALSAAIDGMGQEIFTAAILILAVLMLGWHTTWMARHGREMSRAARHLGRAVASGEKSLAALATVVAVAVLREGSEVALFLYGIAMSSGTGAVPMLVGGLLGMAGGGAVSLLLYRGLLAIPLRHFFTVTQAMIALLAAGMAGQAAALLADDGLLPSWGAELWDSSGFLPVDGAVGRTLHALLGYADRPPGIQLAAWLATLLTLVLLGRLAARKVVTPAKPALRGLDRQEIQTL
jgi:high-affinity iron transporter